MSTYSRPDLFQEAFRGFLAQTSEPLEIVILADGANPGVISTLKECSDPRLRWFATARPSGMVPAWNRVVSEAAGKYFLFCADDDVLLDHAVEHQIELLEANPEVGFCHTDFAYIDDEGNEIRRWASLRGYFIDGRAKAWPEYVIRPRCCMQTALVRRDLWERCGGWDEDAGYPGDNSLYLKLLRVSDVGHVPRLTCKYRVRTATPDSWEKRFRSLREHYALSLKQVRDPLRNAAVSSRQLMRQLSTHLAVASLPLMISSPNAEDRKTLRDWLRDHIWPHSLFGRFCEFFDAANLLYVLERAVGTFYDLRQRIKRLLLIPVAACRDWSQKCARS
jgi:GT2 family glycosyltransferase